MTDLMHYEKGCSPSAIQRKYSLTYEQGYELAERLKKTQELEHENLLLKVANFELRNRLYTIRAFINHGIDDDDTSFFDLLKNIEKVLPND